VEADRNPSARYAHYDSKTEFNEIASLPDTLETSREFAQAKISDDAVYESGHRGKSAASEVESRENSGTGKSTDRSFDDSIIFSVPELNTAPRREQEKKESRAYDIKKEHSQDRSR
jgi:hypothetical protein